jgi:hypothetical protein
MIFKTDVIELSNIYNPDPEVSGRRIYTIKNKLKGLFYIHTNTAFNRCGLKPWLVYLSKSKSPPTFSIKFAREDFSPTGEIDYF